MGQRDLAHKRFDQLTVSTVAPVSGDSRLFWDASADEWVTQDASTGDQLFDEVDIGTLSLSGTAVTATASEINRGLDLSFRVVALTATTPITVTAHEGKVLYITGTDTNVTYTLPEATGIGSRFTFYFGAINVNNTIIKGDDTNAKFYGSINILDVDASAQTAFFAAAAGTDDHLDLDGTSSGGQIGDTVTFVDVAADVWAVTGALQCPAGSNVISMFDAT